MLSSRDLTIKSLLYRSLHRGCKETDILLGEFAKNKINDFDDEGLEVYSDLVMEDDAMIYDWILQKALVPEKYCDLIKNISQFHRLV